MPAVAALGSSVAAWLPSGLGLGRSSLGDLEASQRLISHANDSARHHYAEVKKAMDEVIEARKHLVTDLEPVRRKLTPVCEGYIAQRERLLVGRDGNPPLKDKCMLAQGDVDVALGLGQQPNGCINSCHIGADAAKNEPGPCELNACQGKLRATRQLETMLGGLDWKRRDDEVRKLCAEQPKWDLHVAAPAGWKTDAATQAEEQGEAKPEGTGEGDQKGGGGEEPSAGGPEGAGKKVQESFAPPAVAAAGPPPRPRRGPGPPPARRRPPRPRAACRAARAFL